MILSYSARMYAIICDSKNNNRKKISTQKSQITYINAFPTKDEIELALL